MIHITDTNINLESNSVVTLGNFDGVHIGHKKLIDEINLPENEGLTKVLFSFYPHPITIIKNIEIKTILARVEKYNLIKDMGFDVFVEYPFSLDFSNLSKEEFIKNILIDKLKCKILVIGDGYKFGKDKSGDAKYLKEIGEKHDIKTIIVKHCMNSSEKVSSSAIRDFILKGEIEKANFLLGRNYFIEGIVVRGRELGRTIGFPTINIIPEHEKLLPPNGVYKTITSHEKYGINQSITNIGVKPTVSGEYKTIETNIFNFNENLYDEKVKIEFLRFIRPEKKFDNIDELKEQIKNDIKNSVNN